MSDILKLTRIQVIGVVVFIGFKIIRPTLLKSGPPEWIKTFLLSLPNFFEGSIGVLVVTGIALYLNEKLLPKKKQCKRNLIYLLALIVSGIYVITQEVNLHHLGGANVYDINDIVFSIVGLLVGYLIVVWIQPRVYPLTDEELKK